MLNRIALTVAIALLPSLAFGQANWNDYPTDATIVRLTNTFGQNGETATITSEDILIVKDGATVLTAGITVDDDVSLDFGAGATPQAGLHKITIDLTTSGYDDGDYEVIYKTGTVDTIDTDRTILATFSIGRNADVTDVSDDLLSRALAAVTGPPGAESTLGDGIAWLVWISQAKSTTTQTLRTWFADDGSTAISEEILSDAAGTTTKGEAAAP